MSETMKKAIISTLKMWSQLDEQHQGKSYEQAKMHLESWLLDEKISF